MRPLHDPAMPTEALGALHAPAGNARRDPPLTQVAATAAVVVSLVCMQLVGTAAWAPRQSPYGRQRIHKLLKYHRVVPIGTRHRKDQRNTSGIHDQMALAPALAAVRRVRACFLAPRGLATVAPSTLARLQSIWSYCRSRSSSA